ncbi:CocE/NonD family hydrolase [Streptomyces phaeochromogenes]|uniref:CocE/NonD family hydrolase n=1 Tax=Streptomyces phaeochromogenes TaxID=1923 RepID=UPI002DD7BE07|nr:CocE/NonD family hydrolase [Streptomyces phaeochromogenes]WRZ34550.1 CocE/NonD family hydrolase [Streptomyces phaeochromogenes]
MQKLPESKITEIDAREVMVPMRDGTRLATSVYGPRGSGVWPTLLLRTGYGKDETYSGLDSWGKEAAAEGYVIVVQDLRGRYGSEGAFELADDDRDDAHDTIDWIVSQPWSDGGVGLAGSSFLGLTTLLGVVGGHPAVRAAVPVVAAGPFDGYGYFGPGVVQTDALLLWPIASLLEDVLKQTGEKVDDPAITRIIDFPLRTVAAALMAQEDITPDQVAELMRRLPELMAEQSVAAEAIYEKAPHELVSWLSGHLPWVGEWVAHPDPRDPYWARRDPTSGMGSVAVPMLHAGAWHDIFIRGTIRNFLRVQRNPGAGPQKLVISPYTHFGPMAPASEWTPADIVVPDTLQMGGSSYAPTPQIVTRWFDRFLRGAENGIDTEAPISIYVQRANMWRDEWEWPLARTDWRRLHLRGGGAANSAAGDGRLSEEPPPAGEPADSYVHDPSLPVPTRGGTSLGTGSPAGIFDQRDVESRQDVLVYTSAPSAEGFEVTGPVTVELWVTTSAVDTDFTAKLTDVDPDGRSTNVCDGVTRLRFRPDAPGPVRPGDVQRVTIELSPTSYLFLPGHAARLQIASSNYPLFDVNPNTGRSSLEDGESTTARQTVLHDDRHPSALVLPIIPAETENR